MATEEVREEQTAAEVIDEFIDILACPACGGTISHKGNHLCCNACGRTFPIVNGIPVMLLDAGETKEQPVPGAGAA